MAEALGRRAFVPRGCPEPIPIRRLRGLRGAVPRPAPLGRALLPLSLTRSTNYAWLYGTVCVSPSIEGSVAKLEGKLVDAGGKVRKTSTGTPIRLSKGPAIGAETPR